MCYFIHPGRWVHLPFGFSPLLLLLRPNFLLCEVVLRLPLTPLAFSWTKEQSTKALKYETRTIRAPWRAYAAKVKRTSRHPTFLITFIWPRLSGMTGLYLRSIKMEGVLASVDGHSFEIEHVLSSQSRGKTLPFTGMDSECNLVAFTCQCNKKVAFHLDFAGISYRMQSWKYETLYWAVLEQIFRACLSLINTIVIYN